MRAGKRIILVLAIAATVALFWNPFSSTVAGWALKHYCRQEFDADFKAASIYVSLSGITIEKPCCRLTEEAVAEAERIEVAYRFFLLERRIDLDISVVAPTMSSSKNLDISHFLPQESSSGKGFFTFSGNVAVSDGKMSLLDESESSDVYYRASVGLAKHGHFEIVAAFGDPAFATNALFITADKDSGGVRRCKIEAGDVDCLLLHPLLQILSPAFKDWEATEGRLDGSVVYVKEAGRRPAVTGKMKLKGLKLTNSVAGVVADVPELFLDLADHQGVTPMVAALDLPHPATVSFLREGMPFWAVTFEEAKAAWATHDKAELMVKGNCWASGSSMGWSLEGRGSLFESAGRHFSLAFTSDDSEASGNIEFRQVGEDWHCAEILLEQIGSDHFLIFQELLAHYYPDWQRIGLEKGTLSLKANASLEGVEPRELELESLDLYGLAFEVPSWQLRGRCDRAGGSLRADFSHPHPLQTLTGELKISNGSFHLAENENPLWKLSNIETTLKVQKGVVQQSVVQGLFADMEGTIVLDLSPAGKQIVALDFDGEASKLAPLLPCVLRRGMEQGFRNDRIKLTGVVSQREESFELEGHLQVSGSNCSGETIAFGFELQKVKQGFWGQPTVKCPTLSEWHHLSFELLEELAPVEALLDCSAYRYWMEKETGYAGMVLRSGWFQAYQIPLDKYVSPFVFPDEAVPYLLFSGRGDLMGSFDTMGLFVQYNVNELSIENPNFSINIDQIVHLGSRQRQRAAMHYLDFGSGNSYGVVPIVRGSYLEKNSGLLFEEVSATVVFRQGAIDVYDVDAYCCGAHFFGNIDVDYSDPEQGAFDVAINVAAMQGKVTQLRKLYNGFNIPSGLLNAPLEGDLELKENGGKLNFSVKPSRPTEISSAFHAAVTDGNCSFSPLDLSLGELAMEIDYSSCENTLALSSISGTMFVGKPGRIEEYLFVGEKLAFSDLAKGDGSFDLWVGDQKRDIFRFAGESWGSGNGHVTVQLDRSLTHFGALHPEKFSLVLKNWSVPSHFEFEAFCDLGLLFHDLQRLSRAGIFFLPDPVVDRIGALHEVKGAFGISLGYVSDDPRFSYRLSGKDFSVEGWESDKLLLEGSIKNDLIAVDTLEIGSFAFASEIQRLTGEWKVNCLAARWGDLLLAGVDGAYRDGDEGIDLNINLLEVDLARLAAVPAAASWIGTEPVEGKVKAAGKVRLEKAQTERGWRCDAILSTTVRQLSFGRFNFEDAENFSLHLISDKGVSVRKVKTGIKGGPYGTVIADLMVDHFSYRVIDGEVSCDNINFCVPSRHLRDVADLCEDFLTPALKDSLCQIKDDGDVEGSLGYRRVLFGSTYELTLKRGSYRLFDRFHNIDNCMLTYKMGGAHLVTQYEYNQERFWVKAAAEGPLFNKGVVELSSDSPDIAEREALHVDWEWNEQEGIQILQANGTLAGCSVSMRRDLSALGEGIKLVGSAAVMLPRALSLLDHETADSFINQGIGGYWRIQGKWLIDAAAGLNFQGVAHGSETTFRGYKFKKSATNVTYTPHRVQIANFEVEDPAGLLKIPEMEMTKNSAGYWVFSAPKLTATSLRPWLLQQVGGDAPNAKKPLVITNLEVANLTGKLSDEASYVGSGFLTFTNSSRTTAKNNILAIPAEIITRIGLNPSVLTPVEGAITYEVGGGKIFFTRLKDVYSEGKASKFYLPTSGKEKSYIDFAGNVNVQLKMKQYNLLFKLTEPFVFFVRGTLTKPTYSLQGPSKN